MKILSYGVTDLGLKRTRNEDTLLVDQDMGLFAIADGMGGHQGGDIASRIAVETVAEVVKNHCKEHKYVSPRVMLEEAYTEASSRVFDYGTNHHPSLAGMGTTLISAYIQNDEIFIGNVGDSRAYFYNSRYMWQMTEDHSLLNDHIRAGLIKGDEIKNFQARNVITRSIGFEKEVRCDIIRKKLNPGDCFLLCSDGLYGLVDDREIYQICKDHSMKKAVELCLEKAKDNGGDDNITIIILEVKK